MRKESGLSLESIKKLRETAFNPPITPQCSLSTVIFVSRKRWEEYLDNNNLERDERKAFGYDFYVVDVMKG